MIQDFLVPISSHKEKINSYIDWLFQKKQEFVILKQYNNPAQKITKMFIAIPVRERDFSKPKKDLFNPQIFKTPTFPFNVEDINEYKTLYSGDLFEFRDIVHLLSTITVPSKVRRWETTRLFKDYCCTKEEQLNKYSLISTGETPAFSVNSIYRLLHTKYVTVIEIKFNNKKPYEH